MNQLNQIAQELKDQKFALDQSAIVAQTDRYGVINYVNDYFCQISGYNREELIGKTHRVVKSEVHPPEFFENLWGHISSGQIWRGEICNRAKGGSHYWVYTTIVPFLDEKSKPYQYLSIRQDITALKKAQQTILDQQAALASASKLSAIGEISAAITHEINNPLAVILGRSEMIRGLLERDQIDKETLLRMVQTIEVTGKRIEKIIKSMRSMAHHDEGDEPAATISVQDLVTDASDLCLQRFRNHGVKFNPPQVDTSVRVYARAYQVVQILVNLLNNAHDAVLNLEEKWVSLDVLPTEEFVSIRVTDSGNGIPKSVLPKLFDPFFSTKKAQYGTGLGLSISQSLAKKNAGSLIYDEKSPNTTFILTLPTREKN